MSATTVLHVAEVEGCPIRFFRSRRDGPDMPYVAVLDMLSATRFPVGSRKLYMDNLPREFPDEVDTFAVETDGETALVRVCSHGMAMGIIGIGQHLKSSDIDVAYRMEAIAAVNKLTDEMGLGDGPAFEYCLKAVMR